MYIADQNSIPMNFINQSVGIYLWDSPFSQSLYQGMTDQVLWWWSNLLRFQSTSFNAILSIKCEKRRKIFLCINLTVTFSQKKRKDPFSFSSSYVFYECRQSCTCTQKKKTCFQAKIISNQEMNLGTHIFQEYLRSRAYICLSLSPPASPEDISIKSWTIEILMLTSWISASKNFHIEKNVHWKEIETCNSSKDQQKCRNIKFNHKEKCI